MDQLFFRIDDVDGGWAYCFLRKVSIAHVLVVGGTTTHHQLAVVLDEERREKSEGHTS